MKLLNVASRGMANWTVDRLCGLAGRRRVVRAARFALYRARLDVPNDPTGNGEYALQRWLLDILPADRPATVFDVGANVGLWSYGLLEQARHTDRSRNLRLHAFEPAPDAYRLLTHRLRPESLTPRARLNRMAVSSRCGEVTLHVIGPAAGRNSLHGVPDDGRRARTEMVRAITVDEYVRRHDIGHVDLIKIDTEGHDFLVLKGAEGCFRAGAIGAVQFEYNHRWVHARHFLKDVFDLLAPLGYRIGKLTPSGVEFYPMWDPELEVFVEGNYLACGEAMAERLPQVEWWKARTRG